MDDNFHTDQEPDAPPVEGKRYVLHRENVSPCRWYLAVEGHEPQLISSVELNTQPKFRNWHSDHGYKPPNSTERYIFENMIAELYDTAVPYTKTLPFLQTNAGIIENLVFFFDIHVITDYRRKGAEYMEGKVGYAVRVRKDTNRVHFKWQSMKRFWMRAWNAGSAEIDALKMFITERGGYQGEAGARDWFRWTYWLPLELFDEETRARWFGQEKEESMVEWEDGAEANEEGESNVVRFK